MNTVDFIREIFGLLNREVPYVVLRNYEGLPDNNKSRDIDFAIEKKDFLKVQPELVKLIHQCGWKIVTYLRSDRLITFVCGQVNEDNSVDLLQLDFFYNTSVFGIELIGSDEMVKHRQWNGFLYHTDKAHEFLDKYLYNRAVGAQYPEKYRATREAVENDPEVKMVLKEVFGMESAEACDKASKKTLLLHALKYNFRKHKFGAIGRYLNFESWHLRNYIKGDTGFSIGFTGPDGAGKTTVIDTMIEDLGDVFRKAHVYHHFRPMLFGNISDVAHSAGIKKTVDKNYDDPHRGGKTNALSSLLRLAYYSVDYILGFFPKVKANTRITRLVIFDRYFTDIVCDSRRTRIYLPYKWLYRYGRWFIPQLDYNILLTASVETILGRKRELDRAGIDAINERISFLEGKRGYYRVENEGTAAEAAANILRIVFAEQDRRIASKF